jgi:hypothetical protein
VVSGFELGQNHFAQLITGSMPAGAENVRNLHLACPFGVSTLRASPKWAHHSKL